jgi:hypothetical protein
VDDRFVDYAGAGRLIVTSGATNDSGQFQPGNLRDERFLPFEGAAPRARGTSIYRQIIERVVGRQTGVPARKGSQGGERSVSGACKSRWLHRGDALPANGVIWRDVTGSARSAITVAFSAQGFQTTVVPTQSVALAATLCVGTVVQNVSGVTARQGELFPGGAFMRVASQVRS